MKLPRWECRDAKDQKLLEEWTNARLYELDAEFDAALDAQGRLHLWPIRNALDDERMTIRNHKVAVKDIGGERYVRLADIEPLLRPESRKRGRPVNKARPFLEYGQSGAVDDIDRIRAIWKEYYNRRNRSDPPTALEIAARRYGIEPDRLKSYLSNRHRKPRRS